MTHRSRPDDPISLPLSLFDPRTLGAAHSFNFDGRMLEPAQLLDVLADLPHGVGDVVGILLRTEEDVVWEPNGLFVGGALGDRTVVACLQIEGVLAAPTERRPFAQVDGEERTPVYRFVEEAIAGNAFHLQRAQKRRTRDAAEMFGQILEDD